MIFKELSLDEFTAHSKNHRYASFIQTVNMGNFQKNKGLPVFYVGVVEDDNIIASTMVFGYKSKFGVYYSAPKGLLIDYENIELLSFFTKELKKFLKSKGGYVLNIEPEVLYKQRDINGLLVEDGFDNTIIYQNLLNLGYKHNGFYLKLDLTKQCRWAFVLNYHGKNKDQIFNEFKATTRNLIRKAIKYQVKVKELAYDELSDFKAVCDSAGERRSFSARSLEYYQQMYKAYHEDGYVKFLVATINFNDYKATIIQEKCEIEDKVAKLKDGKSSEGKRKEYNETIKSLTKKIGECDGYINKYGEEKILAGAMFMCYKPETVYLFSGSYGELMSFNAQYLLQWEMIQYGIVNGYDGHNFYGISGDLSKSDERYGVYEFKKGYNGEVVEYIGDFDLVLKPLNYQASILKKKLKGGSK